MLKHFLTLSILRYTRILYYWFWLVGGAHPTFLPFNQFQVPLSFGGDQSSYCVINAWISVCVKNGSKRGLLTSSNPFMISNICMMDDYRNLGRPILCIGKTKWNGMFLMEIKGEWIRINKRYQHHRFIDPGINNIKEWSHFSGIIWNHLEMNYPESLF